eukprot:10295244-Alexandrium_andersonii.AAC.1
MPETVCQVRLRALRRGNGEAAQERACDGTSLPPGLLAPGWRQAPSLAWLRRGRRRRAFAQGRARAG